MVEAMNAMGYDALTVSQMELALGLETIKQREAEAKFSFLSANLVKPGDNQPFFRPYVVLERQGVHIGIIGLSEPEASQTPGVEDQVTVLDPTETARRYVGELRAKVDMLIVLSHLGVDADKALAQAVPGIDIIVGGNTRQLMRMPEQVGNTLIVQQGYRGEWVGRLQATYDTQGVPSAFTEEMITLTSDFRDDPEVAALVKKWAEQFPTPTSEPTVAPTEEPATEATPTAKP